MDPSFNVDLPASVSGSISAASVSTSASASGAVSLPGAGAADGDSDAFKPDLSNASADPQSQPHDQAVAPWLANIKRRAPIACRRSVLLFLTSGVTSSHLTCLALPDLIYRSILTLHPLRLRARESTRVWTVFWHLLQFPRQGVLDSRRSPFPQMHLPMSACMTVTKTSAQVWLTIIACLQMPSAT
jgi:hypothetical protein